MMVGDVGRRIFCMVLCQKGGYMKANKTETFEDRATIHKIYQH